MDIRQLLCTDEEVRAPQNPSNTDETDNSRAIKRQKVCPTVRPIGSAHQCQATHNTDISWNQRQWTEFIEDCLVFLSNSDHLDSRMFLDRRVQPPPDFQGTYCFIYKGEFLHSGNQDGSYWKPSQGVKPTGKNMLRRYFYSRSQPGLSRQISWLNNAEGWMFVEYRRGTVKQVVLNQLGGPPQIDWPFTVEVISEYRKAVSLGVRQQSFPPPSITAHAPVESSQQKSEEEETEGTREGTVSGDTFPYKPATKGFHD
ncbi:hypothetical protein PROFUN_01804 [Planoprotostelium fungivorum]|uniref:Uncharacterized protein n=1 Tax=Planoprotostelium fungivorum TaxID=1890364 RepID=A0A2P6NYQ7_9EUKA|nr:hypothetical protein PROFUN_01804 [Planoprotostelium fungivorum]